MTYDSRAENDSQVVRIHHISVSIGALFGNLSLNYFKLKIGFQLTIRFKNEVNSTNMCHSTEFRSMVRLKIMRTWFATSSGNGLVAETFNQITYWNFLFRKAGLTNSQDFIDGVKRNNRVGNIAQKSLEECRNWMNIKLVVIDFLIYN